MKKLLLLALCLCLFAMPAAASELGLNDPTIADPNEREDNMSYVNTTSFGFGGFGGEPSRPSSHARSDTDSLLPYGALERSVTGEAASLLVFGGRELPLSLEDGGLFTASLGSWDGSAFTEGDSVNALRLASENPQGKWLVPGSVLRTLRKSGIDHVLLISGDTLAHLPTDSFLGGYVYRNWRREGKTDGTLLYLITLPDGTLEVQTEGATYPAGDDSLTCEGFQILPQRGEP